MFRLMCGSFFVGTAFFSACGSIFVFPCGYLYCVRLTFIRTRFIHSYVYNLAGQLSAQIKGMLAN